MATLNPVPVVRDVSNDPTHQRGVHVIAGRLTSDSSTRVITFETRLKSIIAVVIQKENTTTTVPAITVGDSTAYPNTKTVAFTTAASGLYSYFIAGLLDQAATMDTLGAATTITYNPITGLVTSANS